METAFDLDSLVNDFREVIAILSHLLVVLYDEQEMRKRKQNIFQVVRFPTVKNND